MKNKELENYLTTQVRGYYKSFDTSHGEEHFDTVFGAMQKMVDMDLEIQDKEDQLMIAAAFHDTGRILSNKEDHGEVSACILNNDRNVLRLVNGNRRIIKAAMFDIVIHSDINYIINRETTLMLRDADKSAVINAEKFIRRYIYKCVEVKGIYDPDVLFETVTSFYNNYRYTPQSSIGKIYYELENDQRYTDEYVKKTIMEALTKNNKLSRRYRDGE